MASPLHSGSVAKRRKMLDDPSTMDPSRPIRQLRTREEASRGDAAPTHPGWVAEMKRRAAEKQPQEPSTPLWKDPWVLGGTAAGAGAAGLLAYLLRRDKEEEVQ